MDITRMLFSANPRQLCSSSSELDSFPWWETPVRYTWKNHWMPSANEHFWLLLQVKFRTAAVFSHRLIKNLKAHKDVSSKWQTSSLSYKRRSAEDAKRYELQIILRCSFTEKKQLSLHERTDATKENSRAKKNWNWHRRANISCDRTRLLQANILW